MIRKTKIISLILLFFISTTGLPVFSHYCQMMDKKSLSECEACEAKIEKIETSCCSEEVVINSQRLISAKSSCCIDQFDYKKIEDNFSQSANSNLIFSNVIIATLDVVILDSGNEVSNSGYNNYDLPPPKYGKQLLHTIHQLKIDIPIT